MHRYISALHVPFSAPSLHETTYAFSRKAVVEGSLKIWYTVYLPSYLVTTQTYSDADSLGRDRFTRFVACGSSFHQTVAVQAVVFIAMKLKAQLQEDESIGPATLRSDLLAGLEDAQAWYVR